MPKTITEKTTEQKYQELKQHFKEVNQRTALFLESTQSLDHFTIKDSPYSSECQHLFFKSMYQHTVNLLRSLPSQAPTLDSFPQCSNRSTHK